MTFGLSSSPENQSRSPRERIVGGIRNSVMAALLFSSGAAGISAGAANFELRTGSTMSTTNDAPQDDRGPLNQTGRIPGGAKKKEDDPTLG